MAFEEPWVEGGGFRRGGSNFPPGGATIRMLPGLRPRTEVRPP